MAVVMLRVERAPTLLTILRVHNEISRLLAFPTTGIFFVIHPVVVVVGPVDCGKPSAGQRLYGRAVHNPIW